MNAAKHTIYFHFTNGNTTLKDRFSLKGFLSKLFIREKTKLEALHYIFCSDAYLLTLNKQYLNHDTLTDIITFPLSNAGAPVQSDIYISIDRVRENAKSLKVSFAHELHRVIFHGALHLCGYKDKTKREKELMRNKEDEYLQLYFVPRETI